MGIRGLFKYSIADSSAPAKRHCTSFGARKKIGKDVSSHWLSNASPSIAGHVVVWLRATVAWGPFLSSLSTTPALGTIAVSCDGGTSPKGGLVRVP